MSLHLLEVKGSLRGWILGRPVVGESGDESPELWDVEWVYVGKSFPWEGVYWMPLPGINRAVRGACRCCEPYCCHRRGIGRLSTAARAGCEGAGTSGQTTVA